MIRILSGILTVFLRAPERQDGLRINAIDHPWEGDDLADVLSTANPRHRAFQAQAEAGVRHAAIAAQVEIPLERFFGQVVFAQALNEQVVVEMRSPPPMISP